MNAPELSLAGLVTERLERNRNFERPAIFSKHSFGFHHDIDAEVRAGAFGHNPIGLNPEWVPAEHVRTALIVESIEKDAHVVFAKYFVALGYGSAHLAWFVVTMKGQIKRP